MRHVLIPTGINPPILNTCLWAFLAQKPLQILWAKSVGQLKSLPAKVINDWVEDVLIQRLQRWNCILQIFRVWINLVSILPVRLRTSAKFLQSHVLSQQDFVH